MTHLNEITQIYLEEVASKPDFLDLDKDGNKKEPMKKAAKEVEAPKERLKTDRNMFNISKDEQKAAKERLLAKARAKRAKMSEGLDPVGQEDADIDNDGDTDKSDEYLHKRRKAIKSAISGRKRKVSEAHATAKQMHSPHEVPSGDIKGLVKKAVKRIDTDVDGDTDHNDKAKGELGEFIPGVGNKRLYSSTKTTTAKESFSNWRNDLREVVGESEEEEVQIKEKKVKNNIKINPSVSEEFTIIEMVEVSEDTEIDEGIGMTMAKAIGSPPVLSKRMKLKQALINREISKETAKNKKRKFSGKAATANEETEIDEKFSMAADPSKPESPRSTRKAENRKGMSLRSRAIKAVGTQTRQDKETGVREELEQVDEKFSMASDPSKPEAPRSTRKAENKKGMSLRSRAIKAVGTQTRQDKETGVREELEQVDEIYMTSPHLKKGTKKDVKKKETWYDRDERKRKEQKEEVEQVDESATKERKPEVVARAKKIKSVKSKKEALSAMMKQYKGMKAGIYSSYEPEGELVDEEKKKLPYLKMFRKAGNLGRDGSPEAMERSKKLTKVMNDDAKRRAAHRERDDAAKEAKRMKKEMKKEEVEQVDEKFATQYGDKTKLSQSSKRKSLGRGSSVKDGSKKTGYESPAEFRSAEKKFSEEVEQIDEISANLALTASQKADEMRRKAAIAGDKETAIKKSAQASRLYKGVGPRRAKERMNEETEQVDEKLNLKKEKMGDVIKDFYKSDAPQFKGKSKEKRREMAIAAKLTAERGGQKLGESEMAMSPQELSLQKKKTRIDQLIARKRQQALQKQKPQNMQKEERKPEVEVQGKKVAEYERAGKYQGITSKFRKEHPGSRQQPKEKGRKPTEGELTQARIKKHNERVAKHGFTSKQKKESKAREKYDSPRD